MKQQTIARKAKITQGYFSKIINRHKSPTWDLAKALAEITGTAPCLWLEGSKEDIKNALKELNRQ